MTCFGLQYTCLIIFQFWIVLWLVTLSHASNVTTESYQKLEHNMGGVWGEAKPPASVTNKSDTQSGVDKATPTVENDHYDIDDYITLNSSLPYVYDGGDEMPTFYDMLNSFISYRVATLINSYKYCFIIFVAIPGNLFSFLTMKNRMLSTPSCFYIGVMAVFDSSYILSMTVYNAFPVVFNVSVKTSDAGCKVTGFISHFSSFVATGLVVCVSVERCIAITAPFKAKRWCTLRRSVYILIAMCMESFAFNIFWTFEPKSMFHPIYESYECVFINQSLTFERWSSSLHRCFIPVIALTILNIISIVSLRTAANREENLKKTPSQPRNISDSLGKQKNDITFMLLAVSLAFTVLTAPYGAYLIHNFVNGKTIRSDPTMEAWANDSLFASIVFLLIDINHSINFVLFCLMSKRFRQDFTKLWPTWCQMETRMKKENVRLKCCRCCKTDKKEETNVEMNVMGVFITNESSLQPTSSSTESVAATDVVINESNFGVATVRGNYMTVLSQKPTAAKTTSSNCSNSFHSTTGKSDKMTHNEADPVISELESTNDSNMSDSESERSLYEISLSKTSVKMRYHKHFKRPLYQYQ